MKKEQIIEQLQDLCGTSSSSGYASKDFRIHQKTRSSFEVRNGNHLDWSDNRVLTIIFTKMKGTKAIENAKKQDDFISGAIAFLFTAAGEINKNKDELENAKQVKIPWHNITGIGRK